MQTKIIICLLILLFSSKGKVIAQLSPAHQTVHRFLYDSTLKLTLGMELEMEQYVNGILKEQQFLKYKRFHANLFVGNNIYSYLQSENLALTLMHEEGIAYLNIPGSALFLPDNPVVLSSLKFVSSKGAEVTLRIEYDSLYDFVEYTVDTSLSQMTQVKLKYLPDEESGSELTMLVKYKKINVLSNDSEVPKISDYIIPADKKSYLLKKEFSQYHLMDLRKQK